MEHSWAQMTSQWLRPGWIQVLKGIGDSSNYFFSIFLTGCPTVGKLSPKTSRLPLSAPRGRTRSSKIALLPAQANPGNDLDHVTISGLTTMRAYDEPRLGQGTHLQDEGGLVLWTIPQAHMGGS